MYIGNITHKTDWNRSYHTTIFSLTKCHRVGYTDECYQLSKL